MAPDLDALYPFTKVQLKEFSNRHISFIEESWPDGYKVYYFKDSLLLTDTTYHYSRRGKPIVDETENYTYDSRNRLVSKEFVQERSTTRDTIAYDEMNRITYYHSERYYPKRGSKPEKTIVTYDLKKVFSDSLHVVLKDSVSYGGRVMKINNTNDFIYASDVFRTDSVSFEKNEFNMAYKKYWYKKSRSKEYMLGQEKQADCNGLISDKVMGAYDNSQVVCEKSTFEYDAMARLIHSLFFNGYRNVNVFYTYNPQGLIEKKFRIEADYALIFTYTYR
jgi:hypothetical protein